MGGLLVCWLGVHGARRPQHPVPTPLPPSRAAQHRSPSQRPLPSAFCNKKKKTVTFQL